MCCRINKEFLQIIQKIIFAYSKDNEFEKYQKLAIQIERFNGQTFRERGYEHGTILSERIDKSIKIYREQFSKQKNFNEKYILSLCEQYHRGISLFSNDYLEELNSIAISSKQDPLFQSKNPSNIPLRTVLDQAKTLEQALDVFEQNGPGFGGHALVGDDKGQCCSVEFPGDKVRFIRNQPYHTNHFLYTNNNEHIKDITRYQNSFDRYERVKQLWENRPSLQSILFDFDDNNQTYPICRLYKPIYLGSVGTVCSIIMNLKEGTMNITKGNPRQNPKFYEYKLDKKEI